MINIDTKLEDRVECLNRFLGRCKDCMIDYDPNHHPNNLDCKNYKPIRISYFIVNDSDDYVNSPKKFFV